MVRHLLSHLFVPLFLGSDWKGKVGENRKDSNDDLIIVVMMVAMAMGKTRNEELLVLLNTGRQERQAAMKPSGKETKKMQ